MTFWWNQGKLQCFITRRAILEMSLRYGRLILASLSTLALVLSACLPTFFYIGFTNVVCIHSIRSRFWMLATVSSCYSLERGWPSGLQSPSSPFAYSYVPHWCGLCPSALVHSCHMASPFPLQTASHCHDILRVASLLFSAFVTLCLSIRLAAFYVPPSADKSEALLFLLREWPCL